MEEVGICSAWGVLPHDVEILAAGSKTTEISRVKNLGRRLAAKRSGAVAYWDHGTVDGREVYKSPQFGVSSSLRTGDMAG